MEESVVKVEHLSHRYSVEWAIRDINFEVRKKGVLGLLGSNGAGKSTTMNIICGVLNQTEGEVYINGISLRKNPVEAKRYIGFLPQKPPLYPDLTVEEYLTYCANLRLMEKTRSAMPWMQLWTGAEFCISGKGFCGIFPVVTSSVPELRRRLCIIPVLWCWTSRPTGLTRIRLWRSGIW